MQLNVFSAFLITPLRHMNTNLTLHHVHSFETQTTTNCMHGHYYYDNFFLLWQHLIGIICAILYITAKKKYRVDST